MVGRESRPRERRRAQARHAFPAVTQLPARATCFYDSRRPMFQQQTARTQVRT